MTKLCQAQGNTVYLLSEVVKNDVAQCLLRLNNSASSPSNSVSNLIEAAVVALTTRKNKYGR